MRRRAAGPGSEPEYVSTHAHLWRHFFSARRLHFALYDDQERYKVLAGVAPVLCQADVAMLNLEGMITTGGYYNTLRSCTWMFRAHPLVLDLLKDAGVDVLVIGNNHNGDYGPEAQIEETDYLIRAGFQYTGAGVDWEDAARPIYRRIGDVTVGILGMEMTVGEIYVASENTAGLHFLHRAFINQADDDDLVKYLTQRVKEMRKHAHVVIFTPHWDANKTVPSVTQPMRDMARRLITEAGFDAILADGPEQTASRKLTANGRRHPGLPQRPAVQCVSTLLAEKKRGHGQARRWPDNNRNRRLLHIFIDADACPVKKEVYRVAGRYGLDVTLVTNSWMRVPNETWITLEVVDEGLDAADDWIVENAQPHDIVVTADIPLASRCIEKGARVLGPTGKPFTEDNIGQAVATRDLLSDLREAGEITGGPPPLTQRDRSRFLQQLDAMIHSIRRQHPPTSI